MSSIPIEPRIAPRVDLRKRVEECEAAEPLPLVHVTKVENGRLIISSEQLLATKCGVFERDLLYFFLGRPAYRLKNEHERSDYPADYPCVFIVKPEKVTPSQVYPFDTGALHRGLYKSANKNIAVREYELNASYDTALKMVNFAFESVGDYFDGRTKTDLRENVDHFEEVTMSYINIAQQANRSMNDPQAYDARASAVEISTTKHLDIRGAVELAIFPKQYLEGSDGGSNSELIDKMRTLSIEIDTYDWQSTRSPADFRAEIEQKARSYLRKRSGR